MQKSKSLRGVRVAILAMDGFEQVELTLPAARLRKEGAEVRVISLRPGRIRGMNLLWPGKKVKVDQMLLTADAAEFDALLLPGGFINPDFVRQNERALAFVRDIDRAGKPIAVICHGPWALVSANLVRGRRLAAWPGIRDDINNAGGTWVDEAAVRDRNWISSRSPLDIPFFNDAMVSLFSEVAPRRLPVRAPARTRTWSAGKLIGGATLAALAFVTARRLNA